MTPLAKATLTAEYSSRSLEIFEVQYNPTEFSLQVQGIAGSSDRTFEGFQGGSGGSGARPAAGAAPRQSGGDLGINRDPMKR